MTSPRPSIRIAITIQSKGHAVVSRDAPIPALQRDQLLVKTVAVSLNPSDWMLIDWSPQSGAIVGVDFAGIVEEVGLDVGGWNVGDRVAGFVHGGTATGALAVQLAKLLGMHVIATCSPKINPWIKSLRADTIIEYNDPNVPTQIHSLTSNKRTLARDCIGSTQTASFCLSALSTPEHCIYTSLIHLPFLPLTSNPNPNIRNNFTLVYTSFGKELRMKPGSNSGLTVFKASKEDREFMEMFYREVVQRLVNEGMVKYMPVSAENKGSDVWENVLLGIDDVRSGRRGKGEKVVVEVGNERWKGWSMC